MFGCFQVVCGLLRACVMLVVMLVLGVSAGLLLAPSMVRATVGHLDLTGADGTSVCCAGLGTGGSPLAAETPEGLRTPPGSLGEAVAYVRDLRARLQVVGAVLDPPAGH
ncbi:MAG: hypothetical protein ABI776_01255 [Nocardioidaceae bacterium]